MSKSPGHETELTSDSDGYSVTRSQSQQGISPFKLDYAQETLNFAQESISQMKDGDRLSVEYHEGNKTSRIDLYKGFTRVETETNTSSTVFSFSGWKLGLVALVIAVPWGMGVEKIGYVGLDMFNKYFK